MGPRSGGEVRLQVTQVTFRRQPAVSIRLNRQHQAIRQSGVWMTAGQVPQEVDVQEPAGWGGVL